MVNHTPPKRGIARRDQTIKVTWKEATYIRRSGQ
jgi:hypothetical protein